MRDESFEWDDVKAEPNIQDHRISFQVTRLVFADERAQTSEDLDSSHEEDRYFITGRGGDKLMTVVFTYREGRVGIISARLPNKREKYGYNNF
jgi:uncharacterized protein